MSCQVALALASPMYDHPRHLKAKRIGHRAPTPKKLVQLSENFAAWLHDDMTLVTNSEPVIASREKARNVLYTSLPLCMLKA